MTVKQEDLIKQVAEAEGIGVTAVRKIMKAMGNMIFDYLSSATPLEQIHIKLWPGISLDSEVIRGHTMDYGIQAGKPFPDKVRVHGRITRSYKDRVNKKAAKNDEEKETGDFE